MSRAELHADDLYEWRMDGKKDLKAENHSLNQLERDIRSKNLQQLVKSFPASELEHLETLLEDLKKIGAGQ